MTRPGSNIVVERVETLSGFEELRQEWNDLLQMRWAECGGSDAFYSRGLVSFHEEFSRFALEREWLRLFTLRLDGKPAAALYGFRYGRTFYFYQSGFDPSYGRFSIGLIMMGLSIQKAIEEGAEEYDLLHGNESYKFLWARQMRVLGRLEIYPPSPHGWLHQGITGLSRVVDERPSNFSGSSSGEINERSPLIPFSRFFHHSGSGIDSASPGIRRPSRDGKKRLKGTRSYSCRSSHGRRFYMIVFDREIAKMNFAFSCTGKIP